MVSPSRAKVQLTNTLGSTRENRYAGTRYGASGAGSGAFGYRGAGESSFALSRARRWMWTSWTTIRSTHYEQFDAQPIASGEVGEGQSGNDGVDGRRSGEAAGRLAWRALELVEWARGNLNGYGARPRTHRMGGCGVPGAAARALRLGPDTATGGQSNARAGNDSRSRAARAAYSTSKRPAAPCPPPMHMVHTTCLAPRRLPSRRACPTRRAPVMP